MAEELIWVFNTIRVKIDWSGKKLLNDHIAKNRFINPLLSFKSSI